MLFGKAIVKLFNCKLLTVFAVKNSLTSFAILWNLTHPYEAWSIERGSLLQKRVCTLTQLPLIASLTSFLSKIAPSNFWQAEKMSLSPMTMTFVVVNLMLQALFQK